MMNSPRSSHIVDASSSVLSPERVDEVYRNALAAQQRGELDRAEKGYRTVIDIVPNHAGACHFLGLVFHVRKQFDLARPFLEKAISLRDSNAVFHNNYGVFLKDVDRIDDAEQTFRRAIELDPNYADAHSNLGLLFLLRDDLEQADRCLNRALTLNPEHSDALKHLAELRFRQGNFLSRAERFQKADQAHAQAASLPGGKEIWRWKHLGFCPTVFSDVYSVDRYWNRLNERLDEALSRNFPIDWRTLPRDGFTPSFNLPHLNRCCREVKEKFAKLFEKCFPQEYPTFRSGYRNRTKIRIGFVVTTGHHLGFLRVHRLLLEKLDPVKFESYVFCPASIVESIRKSFRRNDIPIVPLPARFDKAVETIRESCCDVVYHWKVGGGTLDYFLALARVAPIQCTSFGTHGTSGAGAIDYYLSTSIIENSESQKHYTERLVLLDGYPTMHRRETVAVSSREELGLPPRGSIYFCPHRPAKYHPMFDSYLKRILEHDPYGNIVMLSGDKPYLEEHLKKRLRTIISPELFRRVCLLPVMPDKKYVQMFSHATCVLDSPVYSGDLTTHDAFNVGVPVVSQFGELLVQRYTASIYRQMGLDSLVVDNANDYVKLAVRLGTEPDYRESVSKSISERNKIVFDTKSVIDEYECFFERVKK